MKTKILLSSKSGIEYIMHSPSISALYDLIKVSDVEIYSECLEVKPSAFYNRVKNDKRANPSILPISYKKLEETMNLAIKNKYDRFIFLINSSDTDYIELIEEYKNDNDSLNIEIIKTTLIGFPLSYAAIEIDKLIKKEAGNYKDFITNLEDNSKLFVFSAKNEVLPEISRIELDEDLINASKNGKLYMIDKKGIIDLKIPSKQQPFQVLVKLFFKEIENKSCIPFIMYSEKYSMYVSFLEKKLLKYFTKLKSISKYDFPISMAISYGYNSLGLGYIALDTDK